MQQNKKRLRDLGITAGTLPVGTLNAITDVPGVRVGHATRIEGEGALIEGVGPIRTGVTAILPHARNLYREKVSAGVCSINGFGKANGLDQIRTRGQIETPIILTNTLNVGRAADALVGYMLKQNPEIGLTSGSVNPIIGECYDAFLSDIRGRHIHEQHVVGAIENALASGDHAPVEEGCVGGGTGTAAYQFKGGIGTSSRVVIDGRFTVGALVQTNFGSRRELVFLGVPLGEILKDKYMPVAGAKSKQSYATAKDTGEKAGGSIMMILATDAPLDSRQLSRLAMRAAFALGRTGSYSHDQSGDFAIAFSTANTWAHTTDVPTQPIERMVESSNFTDQLFHAATEAVEEAILNAMLTATTITGRDGNTLYALPHDEVTHWLKHYHRIP